MRKEGRRTMDRTDCDDGWLFYIFHWHMQMHTCTLKHTKTAAVAHEWFAMPGFMYDKTNNAL